eukprot:RCo008819
MVASPRLAQPPAPAQPAAEIPLNSPLHVMALPSCSASPHGLVAIGTTDPEVRLVDLLSGHASQCLLGHREPVKALCWSPVQPFMLCSGGVDGTLRLWDVRGAGCLGLLNPS